MDYVANWVTVETSGCKISCRLPASSSLQCGGDMNPLIGPGVIKEQRARTVENHGEPGAGAEGTSV